MATATLEADEAEDAVDFTFDADAEFLKCSADCAYFVDTYGVIDDSQGLGDEPTGTTPFKLWASQVQLLWALMTERLVVMLKARQLGMSWAVCGYVLWRCLFHQNQLILMLSKGQPEANELLRRVKALYLRLPEWLRERLPQIADKDNTRELAWTNDSRILSLPQTKNAGISHAAAVVVMDEAGHMKYGKQLFLNIKPTIDEGGQLIMLSTANGVGDLFHSIWTKAYEGVNNFRAIFLPWWARPGRDRAFYRRMVAEAEDPKLTPQNYPANPIEAFLASGNARFDSGWISAQHANIRPPIPREDLPSTLREIDGLKVWTLPEPGRQYVLGADVAEGLETGDYDGCPVFDADSWEQVAEIHGHFEPDEYADKLMAVSDAYNFAEVVVERNNHGHSVLLAFKLAKDENGEPCPFESVAIGHDDKPGWLTNVKTKAPGIDMIAECLRDGLITIRSAALLHELHTYKRLKKGKLGAPSGFHDDLVMGLCILLSYLRLRGQRGTVPVRAAGPPRTRTQNYLGSQ
ncbi:terminase large subunit domain-containing protein [Singulisphaera rosea]